MEGLGKILSVVIAVIVYAALFPVALTSLNSAASNTTLKANSQWSATLSLVYVIGLVFRVPYFLLCDLLRRRNHSVMTVRLIKKLKKLRLRLFTYKPLPRKSLHMRTTIVRNRDSKTTRPAWANLALDKGGAVAILSLDQK